MSIEIKMASLWEFHLLQKRGKQGGFTTPSPSLPHQGLMGQHIPLVPPSPTSAYLEITNVFENKGVVDVDLFADLVIHGVHVGLVHCHALLGQR